MRDIMDYDANNLMEYKGYSGTVEYSAADNVLHGRVVDIRGYVSYEGDSLDVLRKCFEETVDVYLSMCEEDGVEPQRPTSSLAEIRIPNPLQRKLYVFAENRNKTPSQAVEEALESYIR